MMIPKLYVSLCNKYGDSEVKKLFRILMDGEYSNQAIAEKYGVTRERVRQWRGMFFLKETSFYIRPEFEEFFQSRGIQ